MKNNETQTQQQIDLFEYHELLPPQVQDILIKYGEIATYENCEKLLKELKPLGYTFDYYLDAVPFDLTIIKGTKIFALINSKWIQAEFNPTKKQVPLYDKINGKIKFIGIGIY